MVLNVISNGSNTENKNIKATEAVINPKHLSFRNLDPVITITALLLYKH